MMTRLPYHPKSRKQGSALDRIEIEEDTLAHPDPQGSEVVGESDIVVDNLNCAMFCPKDTYFHIHPENTMGSSTQITCPERHANHNQSVKDFASLFST